MAEIKLANDGMEIVDHLQATQIATLVVGVIIAAVANTAFFIWRLISARDDVLSQLSSTEARIEGRMQLIKTSIDIQIDAIKRDVNEHKIKIAEEYLRRDSFYAALNKVETTMSTGLAKVEASVVRLDDKIENLINLQPPT